VKLTASVLCIMASLTGAAPEVEVPDVESIIAQHNATLTKMNRCTVTSEERWLLTRADSTPEELVSTRKCEIRLDGSRANLLVHEVHFPPGVKATDVEPKGSVNEFNYVCDDQVLQIFYPHDDLKGRPAVPQVVNGRLAPQSDDEYFVHGAMGNAAIAFGLTTSVTPIPVAKLIAMSRNEPVVKDAHGYRIEGISPDGTRHKIWFDPDSSYLVSKLTFEQFGEALKDNRFQHNRRVLQARYGFSEKAIVDSVVFEILDMRVAPWNGTHVITSLNTVKTISSVDGAKAVERTSHVLTNWDLNPEFSEPTSFEPRLPVPDGTRVLVEDTPSLEYSYTDGRIVLAVNKKTVKDLDKVALPKRPTRPGGQWIWAVVAGVLGLAWWRIRSADA
jgi:hypothetical protein